MRAHMTAEMKNSFGFGKKRLEQALTFQICTQILFANQIHGKSGVVKNKKIKDWT